MSVSLEIQRVPTTPDRMAPWRLVLRKSDSGLSSVATYSFLCYLSDDMAHKVAHAGQARFECGEPFWIENIEEVKREIEDLDQQIRKLRKRLNV